MNHVIDKALLLGVVSNCWKFQFDKGQSLDELLERAASEGFRAVELRQDHLGDYEVAAAQANKSPDQWERLRSLAVHHRQIEMNLAISLPCFRGEELEDDSLFQAALAAVVALAPSGRPHLRLVDTSTRTRAMDEQSMRIAGEVIARLAAQVIAIGGQLSIEHAYQSWDCYWRVMSLVRKHLGKDAGHLRCCLDPCNLLLTEDQHVIASDFDGLMPQDVSMIHLKQRFEGQIQKDVGAGDIPWQKLIEFLQRRGHQGPWLFEVSPSIDVWQNLQRSIEYLFTQGLLR